MFKLLEVNKQALENDYVTDFPSISLSKEVYLGSMDTDGVFEWICTAYWHKSPKLCQKYIKNDDPFLDQKINESKEESIIPILFIISIIILLISGIIYQKYAKT